MKYLWYFSCVYKKKKKVSENLNIQFMVCVA